MPGSNETSDSHDDSEPVGGGRSASIRKPSFSETEANIANSFADTSTSNDKVRSIFFACRYGKLALLSYLVRVVYCMRCQLSELAWS